MSILEFTVADVFKLRHKTAQHEEAAMSEDATTTAVDQVLAALEPQAPPVTAAEFEIPPAPAAALAPVTPVAIPEKAKAPSLSDLVDDLEGTADVNLRLAGKILEQLNGTSPADPGPAVPPSLAHRLAGLNTDGDALTVLLSRILDVVS